MRPWVGSVGIGIGIAGTAIGAEEGVSRGVTAKVPDGEGLVPLI